MVLIAVQRITALGEPLPEPTEPAGFGFLLFTIAAQAYQTVQQGPVERSTRQRAVQEQRRTVRIATVTIPQEGYMARTRVASLAVMAGVTAATLSLAAGTASASPHSSLKSASEKVSAWYPTKTQCKGAAEYYLRHGYTWASCSPHKDHKPDPWLLVVED
ncbi:hypothetical protein OG417_00890 [Actinoallomurus sp. NBC_01490]|jgi:hypothetical protein|uniref:hypothetical protein n=1 Tax=Actinoallomurus sp. NBC_01490 TaxID=2903557 RepID=UPI002E30EAB1|nr:hypothetical protein [Actinoallomurus sp. NBC_01490]